MSEWIEARTKKSHSAVVHELNYSCFEGFVYALRQRKRSITQTINTYAKCELEIFCFAELLWFPSSIVDDDTTRKRGKMDFFLSFITYDTAHWKTGKKSEKKKRSFFPLQFAIRNVLLLTMFLNCWIFSWPPCPNRCRADRQYVGPNRDAMNRRIL